MSTSAITISIHVSGSGIDISRISTANVGPSASGSNNPPARRRTIKFYQRERPYFEFSNFSYHTVRYNGKDYATSEHLFQSMKFEDEADSETIRTQSSPGAASRAAHKLSHRVRKGWYDDKLNILTMGEVLRLKFTQHECLKELLLSTEDANLIEDSPQDSFWGIGADGLGQNQLGRALERLRTSLKET